jgi:spore protease
MTNTEERIKVISDEIKGFLPKEGLVLVVGLGNYEITPDAFGPKVCSCVLATRHIKKEMEKTMLLKELRPVAVLAPGVLGKTGIEVVEILLSLIKKLNPSALILVDALASKSMMRLGSTIQISNTGISPGSGVGNSRPLIDEKSLGVPIISLGVPTVVDAGTLVADVLGISEEQKLKDTLEKISPKQKVMMVTPRDIDSLIERASKLAGMAINCALQPQFGLDDLMALSS